MNNISLFQAIVEHIFGKKYFINIVNTIGTEKCEAASFIFRTRQEAEAHKARLATTRTFLYVETVSFRSRKSY